MSELVTPTCPDPSGALLQALEAVATAARAATGSSLTIDM
jgi:hypothetical protein